MNRRGFSLVESMVAVVLISAVGIIVVQLLHKNTLNMMWNRETRRAAALADMVLEKYEYLASVNFQTLELHNQTKVPANAFFVTGGNNEGYEGMTITTLAAPPEEVGVSGSRKVTVLISWGAGGPSQTYKVVKYLAAGTGTPGGAPVFVYVTDAAGNGMPGFEVRAAHHFNPAYTNAYGGNEVVGFTDANGYTVLNNVSVAEGHQPMAIMAKKAGSDTATRRDHPNFVQGYYAPPNNTWNTKTITVRQTGTNTVRYEMSNNDFLPLAGISGVLTTTSGSPNGMRINFEGTASFAARSELALGIWDITTDGTGSYEFNNISPGSFILRPMGKLGSPPLVPVGAPGFERGYAGFGGNGSKPWIYQMTMPHPAAALTQNLKVRPLGDLSLTTKNQLGGLLPGTTVTFNWPDIGIDPRNTRWMGISDVNAKIELANLFAGDNESIPFEATTPSGGCPDNGHYLHDHNVSCSADQVNTVNLTLNQGSAVIGKVTDAATPPNDLAGVELRISGLDGEMATGISQADGRFKICGIAPSGTYFPTWPSVAFNYRDQTARRVAATFSGDLIDDAMPAERVPDVILWTTGDSSYVHDVACASDPAPANGASDVITSRGDGSYGPLCAYLNIQGSRMVTVSGSAPEYDAGTIAISTTIAAGGFRDADNPFYENLDNTRSVTHGEVYSHNIRMRMTSHQLSGRLTELGTGLPLQGLTFNPCFIPACGWTGYCPVTTDANGSFGPVGTCIRDRQGGSPGYLNLEIPPGLITPSAQAYSGATGQVNIPVPATPTAPLSINLELNRIGGGI